MSEQEFVNQLTKIKDAEKEKEKLIESAHKKAGNVVSDAQTEAKRILEKAREEAAVAEQQIIDEGKKQLEKEELKIISKAESQADNILSTNLSKTTVRKISEKLLK